MARRDGFRFLGNRNSNEVHDLDNEDTRPSGCQINEILHRGTGVAFYPDTIEKARDQGFDNCAKCIGQSTG